MWEIIGTAVLAGSVSFVAGAYWIVRYQPARGVDLDEADRDAPRYVGSPDARHVTHLVRGGHTACCGVKTDRLPWCDLVTAHPDLVDCPGNQR